MKVNNTNGAVINQTFQRMIEKKMMQRNAFIFIILNILSGIGTIEKCQLSATNVVY